MFETMQSFAKRTGLSYSAIRNMALRSQLPYVMVGNRYMIHVEKAMELLSKMAEEMGA